MRSKLLLFTAGVSFMLSTKAQQKGYYRTPSLHDNTVVFTAEGDLWKYNINSGGVASRLTTHPGVEISPVISPDGKQVAFLGQADGFTDVYIMDITGGVPKRLTFEQDGWDTEIESWRKDGQLLLRTSKYSKIPTPELMLLDPRSGKSQRLPLAEASQGAYDDAGTLFFTRFPNQGSKTKRYKGGFIEQIWKFDGVNEATNITGDYDGTSSFPMIAGDRIFFLSDRDGTMNIWSMGKDGKNVRQETMSKGWDIQTPYINGSKIIYQKGADLWVYDINARKESMLDISLLSDFDQRKTRWIKSPVNSISGSAISPNGNYVAIISRGRVFVSPAKSDRWVEVSRRSGVRFKGVQFINNKDIAVLSDQSGEYEVWSIAADGSGTPKQMTKGSTTMITFFSISPNGKWIAYNDKNEMIRVAETATGNVKFSYDSTYGGTLSFSWSPDSRFLAFTTIIDNLNLQLRVLNLSTMKTKALTTPRLDSYNPAWTADTSWMYFISDRTLKTKVSSPWGPRQPEPYYNETSGIYAMPLDTVTKFPFIQSDSWLTDTIFAMSPMGDTIAKQPKKKTKTVTGDRVYAWDYAVNTTYQVPIKSANLSHLSIADGYLYWIDHGANYEPGGKLYALKIAESKKYEPVEVASGVSDLSVSANNKKLLVNFANSSMAIADANGAKINLEDAKVELDNWAFTINPQEDWNQMYEDAWRMMRDYFYDRDMHQVKWDSVRKQYSPLLSRITDRYELDDLISQVVGELSALHTFVYGGDKRTSPEKIPVGYLGAIFEHTTQGEKIAHIYRNDPDYPDFNSPLGRPELKIKEGDIITAINNVPLNGNTSMAELLTNKVNIPVKLSLLDRNNRPYEKTVRPFSLRDNYGLKYLEWELERRNKVDSMSNSEFGYVHLRAMGGDDMDAFVKQFYPVFNRKGLIIDVRHNFGGNIDSWVLEKLMRKAWMYWQGRAGGPTWNMQYAFRGPMVILCDQVTASDGEAVTEGFRRLGLGKVIGMRTWGGEIWLSSSNRLVDNGIASAAEFGVFGPEGQWLIEGRGVEPDITVDNLPMETFKGKDRQLEAAVNWLKEELKKHPVPDVVVPKHPDKSFDYKRQ